MGEREIEREINTTKYKDIQREKGLGRNGETDRPTE